MPPPRALVARAGRFKGAAQDERARDGRSPGLFESAGSVSTRRFDLTLFARRLDAVLARSPGARLMGRTVIAIARTGSTQDEARRLVGAGAPHGTIVIAEEQTAGRGRRGRTWQSPAGSGIWTTVIIRHEIPPAGAPFLTIAGALAVCEAVRACGVAAAEIKWPNDLIVRERKFAGVLGEIVADAGATAALIGIGIDVDLDPASLPPEVRPAATSLRSEGLPAGVDRETLLAEVLGRLEEAVDGIGRKEVEPILRRFVSLSPSSTGRRVVVDDPDSASLHHAAPAAAESPASRARGASSDANLRRARTIRGTSRGIGPDGGLLLEDPSGRLWNVRYGGTLRFEDTHATTSEPRDAEAEAAVRPEGG